jgi:ubiquinone/menaquinone biosynthesis C-methylase UbiE
VSFDRLAKSYQTLETLRFGGRLQACRVAGLSWLAPPREVLLLGEGNGRFLLELVRTFDEASIHVIDASPAMLTQARKRVATHAPAALDRIRFQQGRVPHFDLDPNFYDLLVTNFFLDCFDRDALDRLLPFLDRSLTSEATWLYADFCLPERPVRRLRARFWLTVMYRFFRLTTDLRARALVDPLPALRELGWVCEKSVRSDRDFLLSCVLKRAAGRAG